MRDIAEATRIVFRTIAECLIVFWIIGMLFAFIGDVLGVGVDDSDKSAWKRSGFRIMTDHKTGIEYLSDGKGGLIKRSHQLSL